MPILITAKVNGFRRCGIAHSDETVEYPDDHFTKEQLKTLQSEPMLVVSVGEKGTEQKQPDASVEKQITALKVEVQRLNEEKAQLSMKVEELTKNNAELYDNVIKLTQDNADLVDELSVLKAPIVSDTPSDDKKLDEKPTTKGK